MPIPCVPEGPIDSEDSWNDNRIQFPRLLAEIRATQNLDYEALCDSMDLTVEQVDELLERAEDEFAVIKHRFT